jgi:hypothetical protein
MNEWVEYMNEIVEVFGLYFVGCSSDYCALPDYDW